MTRNTPRVLHKAGMDMTAEISKNPSASAGDRFEALHALYENKQQWVRHYETLLAQLTPLSATTSLAFSAYIADKSGQLTYAKWTLIIPLALSLFALWFTWWCDSEIKRQFRQIVSAETGMGFYQIIVDDKPVLPIEYKDSPVKTRPIIFASYFSQAISLTAVAAVVKII